jgi:hypothetical protein
LFVLSVPIAFLSTVAAVVVWFLPAPTQLVLNRLRPAEAADWL